MDELKLGAQKPPMPYSDTRLLNVLSHTLWFLPNVASCYAMANLLAQKQNAFYHDYKVNVCAGARAGIGVAALEPVRRSMGDPLESKTITLSCGKLTTGVTIKPWTMGQGRSSSRSAMYLTSRWIVCCGKYLTTVAA